MEQVSDVLIYVGVVVSCVGVVVAQVDNFVTHVVTQRSI